jgi:metallophosphoesterase superfamily enzyme
MLILNDIHVGFKRIGGTTPSSQEDLRNYLLSSLRETVMGSEDDHLLILGDLFDAFEVPLRDLLDVYALFHDWLSAKSQRKLTLVAGNHDHTPKALRVSSFEILSRILQSQFDLRITVIPINGMGQIVFPSGVWAIAHCESQAVFEDRLNSVLTDRARPKYLLVHCNYDNKFVANHDHSLNISRDLARKFKDVGTKIVFAHEHQAKHDLDGHVIVMGNQWPTSIADCLGNAVKRSNRIVDGALLLGNETWHESGPTGFSQVDWTNLVKIAVDLSGFIRVTGEATAAQAADVINAISDFRRKSKAYVVSNAVAVDGIVAAEALPDQFEAARRFDVMQYIEQHLDADEIKKVRKLMEEPA